MKRYIKSDASNPSHVRPYSVAIDFDEYGPNAYFLIKSIVTKTLSAFDITILNDAMYPKRYAGDPITQYNANFYPNTAYTKDSFESAVEDSIEQQMHDLGFRNVSVYFYD